jgi:hypothetical protein
MMGLKQAYTGPRAARLMGIEAARVKAAMEDAEAKSSAPCEIIGTDGKHQWHYDRGWLTGGLYRSCQCGARSKA